MFLLLKKNFYLVIFFVGLASCASAMTTVGTARVFYEGVEDARKVSLKKAQLNAIEEGLYNKIGERLLNENWRLLREKFFLQPKKYLKNIRIIKQFPTQDRKYFHTEISYNLNDTLLKQSIVNIGIVPAVQSFIKIEVVCSINSDYIPKKFLLNSIRLIQKINESYKGVQLIFRKEKCLKNNRQNVRTDFEMLIHIEVANHRKNIQLQFNEILSRTKIILKNINTGENILEKMRQYKLVTDAFMGSPQWIKAANYSNSQSIRYAMSEVFQNLEDGTILLSK